MRKTDTPNDPSPSEQAMVLQERQDAGLPVEPPALPPNRERHEALAAVEREIDALLGARKRNLPTLIAKLRALL